MCYNTHRLAVHFAQGILLAWQVSDVPLKFRLKQICFGILNIAFSVSMALNRKCLFWDTVVFWLRRGKSSTGFLLDLYL